MERMLRAIRAIFPPFQAIRLCLTTFRHCVIPAATELAFQCNTVPWHDAACNPAAERPPEFIVWVPISWSPYKLEPMTGVEPVTSSLPRTRSTN
jgi:hypothetical protein